MVPGTRDQAPRDQGPGTRDQGPRTWDQGPGTRGQGEAKRTLGRLPGEHLGASLVKEDFEGKTSKLAEAFDEK